ncbi:bzip transcription factor protein [Pyrenophora tritici-repentis]|nr:bzip transcription factor protein [Pyrenophora tritici-repentis]
MATAVQSAMTMAPFNGHPNQCVDPNEFFDFGQMPSPTQPATLKREQSTISNINSPTSTNIDDDLQTPAKPSHEYERFKQQTGLPSGSIAGLSAGYNPGFAAFSSTGLDEYAMMGGDSTMDGTWGNGLPIDVGMNMGIDYRQNSFVYSEASQDDFVDPSAITQDTHQPNSNVRVWPASTSHAGRKTASPLSDAHTEEMITRVVAQIRADSQNASSSMQDNNQGLLPHIIRAKKDEEDMDEDERLLASEEGKKLSSKERRQLRNKVSARAFRSRRKEYIGQLEGEVAMKVNEANELRTQNRLLMEENARSRAFIERLLRHQAFTPFLEELSRDESLQLKAPMTSMSSSSAPAPTAPAPAQFPQQHWGVNNGFNFQQPVAFAVTELPEGPANPLDIEAMSGKGYSALFHGEDDAPAEAKAGYPVIERPAQSTQAVATIEETEEEDEEYALYFSSPTTIAASAPLEDQENIFTNPDKALAHYSLVISEEANEAHLADRLQRKIAAMNTVMQRVADMTSMLDS